MGVCVCGGGEMSQLDHSVRGGRGMNAKSE